MHNIWPAKQLNTPQTISHAVAKTMALNLTYGNIEVVHLWIKA